MTLPLERTPLTAAYTSAERSANARKQLRDKYGRWIEMGGGLSWTASNGTMYTGIASGVNPASGYVTASSVKFKKPDGSTGEMKNGVVVNVAANTVSATPPAKAHIPTSNTPAPAPASSSFPDLSLYKRGDTIYASRGGGPVAVWTKQNVGWRNNADGTYAYESDGDLTQVSETQVNGPTTPIYSGAPFDSHPYGGLNPGDVSPADTNWYANAPVGTRVSNENQTQYYRKLNNGTWKKENHSGITSSSTVSNADLASSKGRFISGPAPEPATVNTSDAPLTAADLDGMPSGSRVAIPGQSQFAPVYVKRDDGKWEPEGGATQKIGGGGLGVRTSDQLMQRGYTETRSTPEPDASPAPQTPDPSPTRDEKFEWNAQGLHDLIFNTYGQAPYEAADNFYSGKDALNDALIAQDAMNNPDASDEDVVNALDNLKSSALALNNDAQGLDPDEIDANGIQDYSSDLLDFAEQQLTDFGGTLPDEPADSNSTDSSGIIDISDWTKTGIAQGSNPGGVYTDTDGNKFYVKHPETSDHARNEVLARKLYDLTGVDSAQLQLADDGSGKLSTASPLIPGAKQDLSSHLDDPAYLDKIRDGFAVDAWIQNWDVAGLGYDNIVTDGDGNPVRVDPGGSLLYRAQGLPKGDAFGDSVGEWNTLRDGSNDKSAALFAGITDDQLRDSAQRVTSITDQQIDDVVDSVGFGNDKASLLKSRLKARRDDIASRVAQLDATSDTQSADSTPEPSVAINKFEVLADTGLNGDGYYPGTHQWGKYGAAGVMIRHVDDQGVERFLMVQRGPIVSTNQGKWQLPGGALNSLENDYQGTARELSEELEPPEGYLNKLTPAGEVRFDHPSGWHYTNIAADVAEQFEPKVDGTETGDAGWYTRDEIAALPLHPALAANLDGIFNKFSEPSPTQTNADDPNTPDVENDLLEAPSANAAPESPTPDANPEPASTPQPDAPTLAQPQQAVLESHEYGTPPLKDANGNLYVMDGNGNPMYEGSTVSHPGKGYTGTVKWLETNGKYAQVDIDQTGKQHGLNVKKLVVTDGNNSGDGSSAPQSDSSSSTPAPEPSSTPPAATLPNADPSQPAHVYGQPPLTDANGQQYVTDSGGNPIYVGSKVYNSTKGYTGTVKKLEAKGEYVQVDVEQTGKQHGLNIKKLTVQPDSASTQTSIPDSQPEPQTETPDVQPSPGDPVPSDDWVQSSPVGTVIATDQAKLKLTKNANGKWDLDSTGGGPGGSSVPDLIDNENMIGYADDPAQWHIQSIGGESNPTPPASESSSVNDIAVGDKITSVDWLDSAPTGTKIKSSSLGDPDEFFTKHDDGKWYDDSDPTYSLFSDGFSFSIQEGDLSLDEKPDLDSEPQIPNGAQVPNLTWMQNADPGTVITEKDGAFSYVWTKTDTGSWTANVGGSPLTETSQGIFTTAGADALTVGGDATPAAPGSPVYSVQELEDLPAGSEMHYIDPNGSSSDETYIKTSDGQWKMPDGSLVSSEYFTYEASASQLFHGPLPQTSSEPSSSASSFYSTSGNSITSAQQLDDAPEGTTIFSAGSAFDSADEWTKKPDGKWYDSKGIFPEGASSTYLKSHINSSSITTLSGPTTDASSTPTSSTHQGLQAGDDVPNADWMMSAPVGTVVDHSSFWGKLTKDLDGQWYDADGVKFDPETETFGPSLGTTIVSIPATADAEATPGYGTAANPAPVTVSHVPIVTPKPKLTDLSEGLTFTGTSAQDVSLQPDTSSPLYDTPAPTAPAPLDDLETPWVPDGWMDQLRETYLNKPNKSADTFDQSIYFSTAQQVVNTGDKQALSKLLEKKYINQQQYDDTLAHIEAVKSTNEQAQAAHTQSVEDFKKNLDDWNKANGVSNHGTVDPDDPPVSTNAFLGGDPDWTKAHPGTPTADAAMDALRASDKLATRGVSFATDSGDIEDLDVRAQRVIDVDGLEKIELKFKLTSAAGDRIYQELYARADVTRTNGVRLPKRQFDEASGLHRYLPGENSYHTGQGTTFKWTDANGVRYEMYRGAAVTSLNAPTVHNSVRIFMPSDSDSSRVESSLRELRVSSPAPASEEDVRRYAENKLLSVGAGNTDPTKQVMTKSIRTARLQSVMDKYGISPKDLVFTRGPQGRMKFKLGDEATQKLIDRSGVKGFKHAIHNPNTDILSKILNGAVPGLHSTHMRWSEGIGASGQSSNLDMTGAGADYVYTTPKKTIPSNGTSGAFVMIHPKAAAQRLDVYGNQTDNGSGEHFDKSLAWDLYGSGAYEMTFKHSVPVSEFWYMSVASSTAREDLIYKLKSQGVTEINGTPVENFIITGSMQPPTVDPSVWSVVPSAPTAGAAAGGPI